MAASHMAPAAAQAHSGLGHLGASSPVNHLGSGHHHDMRCVSPVPTIGSGPPVLTPAPVAIHGAANLGGAPVSPLGMSPLPPIPSLLNASGGLNGLSFQANPHLQASGAMGGTSSVAPVMGSPNQSPPKEACWEGGWGETCASAVAHTVAREAQASRSAQERQAQASGGDGFGGAPFGNFGFEDQALIRNLDSLLLDEPDLN